MGVTYAAVDAHDVRIVYSDRKRWWWALSVIFPLFPFIGIAAHAATGYQIMLGTSLVISFGLLPLLDALLGQDEDNPPESVVAQLDGDPYYRWLTWSAVPLHFIALIGAAWWVGTHDLSWWAFLMFAYVAGSGSGLGINTGHELGHKHNALEQWLARLVLAVPMYGHFTIEHGRGHHRWVSTPEDHASARMGESIYRFMMRELPGGIVRAWTLERERLAQQGRSVWSLHNTMLQSYVVGGALQITLVVEFGWKLLPFLLLHNAMAWWGLTSANYVQHYGLLRLKGPDGRYETPKPHHSWNTNHLVTNLALFHLQRHSDHHAYAARRYQSLRHFEELPQLPGGYLSMFPLAYVPSRWFKVIDELLLALPHVQGDLDKVNVDPRERSRIYARYGQSDNLRAAGDGGA